MLNLSKYDVLNLLSKKMPFYAATQWLKTPHEGLQDEAPSELMKENKINEVYAQLKKDLDKKKK